MYQYTFDNEVTNKVNNTTNNAKTIFDKFNDIDNRYGDLSNVDNQLNLEKMEYTKPTNEQVNKQAESSLQEYKNSSINNINENFDKQNQKINSSIEQAKQDNNTAIKTIKNSYGAVKAEAKDDAIKRGLARSSIIVNTLSELDNGMLNALNQKADELNGTLKQYETEKQVLESQKQTALNNFDIEYAVKLQDKINNINNSIEEKAQEVLEYNNKIEETLAKWQKEQEQEKYDRTIEMAKLMNEQGITMFEVLKQNEKYELAKSHFAGMTKDEALNELANNSDYQKHLGSAFYNKLVNDIQKGN